MLATTCCHGYALEEVFLAAEAKESKGEVDQLKPILQPGGNETDQHGLQVGCNLTQHLVRQEGTSSTEMFQSSSG